jgi:hypothetical protein
MQSWFAFAVAALALVAILALFLSRRHVLLLSIAAAAGIIATMQFDWRAAPLHSYVYKMTLMILAVSVVSAILGYLSPSKAWQWGLVPFLADAIWQVWGPLEGYMEQPRAYPVHFPILFSRTVSNRADGRRRTSRQFLTASPSEDGVRRAAS